MTSSKDICRQPVEQDGLPDKECGATAKHVVEYMYAGKRHRKPLCASHLPGFLGWLKYANVSYRYYLNNELTTYAGEIPFYHPLHDAPIVKVRTSKIIGAKRKKAYGTIRF